MVYLTGCVMWAQAEVRIVAVEGVDRVAPRIGLQAPYMQKFLLPPAGFSDRVIRIGWVSDEPVPSGTLVIFEYRTAKGRDRVRYVKMERLSRGPQETILRFEEADEIVAWRVRVMHGARPLAVRTSARWR